MSAVIVGIHGLANKPDKQTLAEWWEAAIREGLDKNCGERNADFEYVTVYWADLLYKYPQHQDFDFDDLHNEQVYSPAPAGALKRYKERWMDDARAAVLGGGETVLDAVKERFGQGSVADWLLERKMRDLAYYYDATRRLRARDGQMRQARLVLMDELSNVLLPLKGRRLMLIAHSMGTIISYDVLRDLGRRDRDFPLHHYVTIGSPLGMPHVKANIDSLVKSLCRSN